MADDRVMEMVRAELAQNPGIRTADLLAKAKKLDKTLGKLSIRQFHARYPLQVKRQLAVQRPRRRRPRRKATVHRDAIRTALLEFARALLEAEGKADVVAVIAGVDKLVDRVVVAATARASSPGGHHAR